MTQILVQMLKKRKLIPQLKRQRRNIKEEGDLRVNIEGEY